MFLIELFVPAGTLSKERRARVAQALGTALVTEDMAASETVQAMRDATDVLVHEVGTWYVGERPAAGADDGDAPRYLVRVSVPGAWRKEMSAHVVTNVTRALGDMDDEPERLYHDSAVQVQVVGISEGSYGLYGQVYGSNQLAEMLSEPFRQARRDGTARSAPEGMFLDPICGALLPRDIDGIVVAEVDGVTHGFCCAGCRDLYLAETAA